MSLPFRGSGANLNVETLGRGPDCKAADSGRRDRKCGRPEVQVAGSAACGEAEVGVRVRVQAAGRRGLEWAAGRQAGEGGPRALRCFARCQSPLSLREFN